MGWLDKTRYPIDTHILQCVKCEATKTIRVGGSGRLLWRPNERDRTCPADNCFGHMRLIDIRRGV